MSSPELLFLIVTFTKPVKLSPLYVYSFWEKKWFPCNNLSCTTDKSIPTGIKYWVCCIKRALFDLQFVHNLFWLKLKWYARSKLFYCIYCSSMPWWSSRILTKWMSQSHPVFYTSGNRFVRRTGMFGNLIFSLVPSDNRNTRSTCPTSVFTGTGQSDKR
jgi:hypothetical protein